MTKPTLHPFQALDDALITIEGLTYALNELMADRVAIADDSDDRLFFACSTVAGCLFDEMLKAKAAFQALNRSNPWADDNGDDPKSGGHAIDPADMLRMAVKGTTDLMKRRSTKGDDPEASDRAA